MKQKSAKLLIGWIIACAMVIIGTAAPTSSAFAHQAVQHAVVLDDHGHSHDDDSIEYEASGAHNHAHTGDHSHDVPSLPPFMNAGVRLILRELGLHLRAAIPHHSPISLDRPPKGFTAA